MVLGLKLGSKKKQTREPDLSRYDYHYNKSDEYYKSSLLSADAAYAAAVNSNSNSNGRVYSMINPGKSGNINSGGAFRGTRSYSMMSNPSPVYGRRNISVGSRTNSMRSGQVGSRANSLRNGSVIIKTHEVKDIMGRTQSITTQTIRRINGMEYVETTTQSSAPIDDPQLQFQQFSNDDDFAIPLTPPHVSPSLRTRKGSGKATRGKQETRSSGDDGAIDYEDDDGEEFADASDVIDSPGHSAVPKLSEVDIIEEAEEFDTPSAQYSASILSGEGVIRSNTKPRRFYDRSSQKFPESTDIRNGIPVSTHAYKSLSVANKGNTNDLEPQKPGISRKSTMSQRMSLREPFSFESPANPVVQPRKELKTLKPKTKKALTNEEMYSMALEIAKQKYMPRENSLDVQRSEMTPILEDGDTEMVSNGTGETSHDINESNTAMHKASEPGQVESRKKVKNILDKVIQFSQENSGYQPSKQKVSGRTYSKEHQKIPPDSYSVSSMKVAQDLGGDVSIASDKRLQKKKSLLGRIFGGNKGKKLSS